MIDRNIPYFMGIFLTAITVHMIVTTVQHQQTPPRSPASAVDSVNTDSRYPHAKFAD